MRDLDQRPRRILEAAGRLIGRYGFDKTTMEDIAREAGVSKGALYLEWPSKDHLFDALVAFEMKRLLSDLRERVENDPQGGQMANLYRHTLLALQANPLICALYTRDNRILGDFVRRQDPRRYTDRLLFSREAVQQMQAAGLLRADLQPEVITYLFSILALGFIGIGDIVPRQDAPPLEAVGAGISALVQSGLATSGGSSHVGKQAVNELIDYMLAQYGAPEGGKGQ